MLCQTYSTKEEWQELRDNATKGRMRSRTMEGTGK